MCSSTVCKGKKINTWVQDEKAVSKSYSQIKMLGIEEHKRAEQHMRRMCAKLFALPQVLLLHARHDVFCKNGENFLVVV